MNNDIIEAWLIHNRINTYVVESLTHDQWEVDLAKGKSVRAQFTHLVSVRLMWLKAIDPLVMPAVPKLEPTMASQADVVLGLNETAKAIETVVRAALQAGKSVKNFKPSSEAFICYLVSHESGHRAMAELALRQAGMPLDEKVAYGQWEWGSRAKEL